jgi:hypothetical protein
MCQIFDPQKVPSLVQCKCHDLPMKTKVCQIEVTNKHWKNLSAMHNEELKSEQVS